MKRVLVVLCFVVLCAMSVSFADMGAPAMDPYTAYVSNFEGAEYYDYQTQQTRKLEYGTKVFVVYEDYYSSDNITYVTAQVGVDKETSNVSYGQLKLSDISLTGVAEVIPENLTAKEPKKAIYKTKTSGAEMKKGPAEVYESSGAFVPNGEEVLVYDGGEYMAWYYITYKGKSGWIKRDYGTFYFYPEYQELTVVDNIRLQDIVYNENASKVIVPAGTKITDYYQNGGCYYFTYQGTEGYLYAEQLVVAEKGTVETSGEGVNVYRSLEIMQDPVTEEWDYPMVAKNIAKGTVLSYDARTPDGSYYYVTYQNERGWVHGYNNIIKVEEKAKLRTDQAEIESGEENVVTPVPQEVPSANPSSPINVIILCVVVAAVVTLTATITIAIFNKKD